MRGCEDGEKLRSSRLAFVNGRDEEPAACSAEARSRGLRLMRVCCCVPVRYIHAVFLEKDPSSSNGQHEKGNISVVFHGRLRHGQNT